MTPAIRLLEREGVAFSQHPYQVDADAEGYAVDAAEKLGVDPQRVFKTLVCQAEGIGLVLVLVPAAGQLNLKALKKQLGVKKADLADPGVAERATGSVVGGISPLAPRRRLPVLADATLAAHLTVYVNGGRRGLMLELAPTDLLRVTGGELAALADI